MATMQVFIKVLAGTALALSLAGCHEKDNSDVAHFFAIDTSGSAKPYYAQFGKSLSQDLTETASGARVVVFRFDSNPAEIYDGTPPETLEQAAGIVKKVENHKSSTPGTNFYKLLDSFEKAHQRLGTKFSIKIYTDCGTEDMTKEEKEQTRALVSKWHESGDLTSMEIWGVQDGWRETIREIVPLPENILSVK